MTKSYNKSKKLISATASLFLATSIFCCIPFAPKDTARAYENMSSEQITITNANFNTSSSTYLQTNPSGWTGSGSSSGKYGVITTNADSFKGSDYALTTAKNPKTAYSNTVDAKVDDYVLMLNSNETESQNYISSSKYRFTSSNIDLDKDSFYSVSVFAKTIDNARASINIDGLEEDFSFTSIETPAQNGTANGWQEFKFFIATSSITENINIELCLGSENYASSGTVFFDNVSVYKLSENYFANQSLNANSRTKVLDLRNYIASPITNANFEESSIYGVKGFEATTSLSTNVGVQTINVQTSQSMTNLGLDFLGNSQTQNNQNALLMYSKNDDGAYATLKSTTFDIAPYALYKITLNAKVSDDFKGEASFAVKEQDNLENFYGEDNDFWTYEARSQKVNIVSNTENALTNDYTAYTMYVRGHELYATTLALELSFGNKDTKAVGAVVFDDIKFEELTPTAFAEKSTTNSETLTLSTLSGTDSLSIENGTFNIADTKAESYNYPIAPASWKHKYDFEDFVEYGIVNTYSEYFETNKANFGNPYNVGNPDGITNVNNDVNNVLLMYNKADTFQSITSPSFTTTVTAENSYEQISFDYTTIKQNASQNDLLTVYVLDSDGNILYAENGLSSDGKWSNYTITIKNSNYSTELNLQISLGTKNNPVNAFAFIDNVEYKTVALTEAEYDNLLEQNKAMDFNSNNWNFFDRTSGKTAGFYKPYRYTQSLETGSNGSSYGGILDMTTANQYGLELNTDSKSNEIVGFMIEPNKISSYTLTAKDAFTLKTGTYYQISIDVFTNFLGDIIQGDVSKDEYKRVGATLKLVGLSDSFTEIKTDRNWTTYTFYVSVAEDTNTNLCMGIENQNSNMTYANAFFDNFNIIELEEKDFNNNINNSKDDETVISMQNYVAPTEEDQEDEAKETHWTENLMYLIPSAFMLLSLIFALATYFMKKIKIKKWEVKRASEYDRETTLIKNQVRAESEKERQLVVNGYEKNIAELKTKLAKLEEAHKNVLKEQKTQSGTEITKDAERAFKAYANKYAKLENEIKKLENKIENCMTAEYLLGLQRKIVLRKVKIENESKKQEYDKRKQAEKAKKLEEKKLKEQEKAAKNKK